jgi:hypothetical protein
MNVKMRLSKKVEKCYMYLNFYKNSLNKMMRNIFIGTGSISFY